MNSALRAERLDTGAQDWQANCDWRAGGLRHLSAGELMQEGGRGGGHEVVAWVSGSVENCSKESKAEVQGGRQVKLKSMQSNVTSCEWAEETSVQEWEVMARFGDPTKLADILTKAGRERWS